VVQFVILVGLLVTVCFVIQTVARVLNKGCRFRCSCVADSVALGALASIAENSSVRHGDL